VTAADLPALRALTDADFAAAVSVPGATLVHFTATWCAPCTRAAVEVAGLFADLRGRKRAARAPAIPVVMTADIDAAPHAANAAGLTGVPCLVLYRDGARAAQLTGQWSRQTLREWFDGVMEG
jgi:thioredoxin 1